MGAESLFWKPELFAVMSIKYSTNGLQVRRMGPDNVEKQISEHLEGPSKLVVLLNKAWMVRKVGRCVCLSKAAEDKVHNRFIGS